MKYLLTSWLLLGLPLFAFAQNPEASDAQVAGANRQGWRLQINANVDAVQREWVAYWKEIGKAKKQMGDFVISEMVWSGLSSAETEAYAQVTEIDAGHTWVWLGVESAATGPGLDKDLLAQQILSDFEYQYYRNELVALIAEAEAVEVSLSKRAFRSEKQITGIEGKLERNAAQKEKLEAKLEQNEQDKINLEEALVQEKALRQQADKDMAMVQERLAFLRNKLANFTGNDQD